MENSFSAADIFKPIACEHFSLTPKEQSHLQHYLLTQKRNLLADVCRKEDLPVSNHNLFYIAEQMIIDDAKTGYTVFGSAIKVFRKTIAEKLS